MTHELQQGDIWAQANSLEDLGEATARWLEERISYHPCYGGDADPETASVVQHLALYNRGGLVTTFSQPAETPSPQGFSQRACVEGYSREELAKKIATLALYTDLLVFIYPPNWQGGYQIPITLDEFHPFTWCGGTWGFEELECFEKYCSPTAVEQLKSSWKTVVIDLQWGRIDHLWNHLSDIFTNRVDERFSVIPSDPGLGTDFVF